MDKNIKIEDFIDGNLTDKEHQELLILKDTDPDFNKDIALRAEINNAIRDINYMELHKLLIDQGRNQELTSQTIKFQHRILKTWHLAAASFALILVVGGLWFILSNTPFSKERLVSKYYKPVHPVLLVRSVEENTDAPIIEDFQFNQQNDWTKALKYFSSLDNQITANFYSGVCYIELEQYNKAIDSFKYVINDNDNLFVEQAEWYLGIIFLKNNKMNQAIDQFDKISNSESHYSSQAKEILKYIN